MTLAHRLCGFLAGLFLLRGGSLAWPGTGAAFAALALALRPVRPRGKAPA